MIYVIFIIPLLMLITGFLMFKHPPKKVNLFVGYRTRKSMKDQSAWKKANKYCGKVWIILGLGMFVLSLILYTVDVMKLMTFSEALLSIYIFIQVGFIILSVIYVEKKI